MREILFRGKRVDNGEWIEGGVLQTEGWTEISAINDYPGSIFEPPSCDVDNFEVIPKTVGQYVGIKDIKDKKIFEGDIVKFKRVNALGYTTSRVGEVKYYDELPIFYIYANTGDAWDWVDCEEIVVIGNIHDNPELMERECD